MNTNTQTIKVGTPVAYVVDGKVVWTGTVAYFTGEWTAIHDGERIDEVLTSHVVIL
jgi:hypothetical protein